MITPADWFHAERAATRLKGTLHGNTICINVYDFNLMPGALPTFMIVCLPATIIPMLGHKGFKLRNFYREAFLFAYESIYQRDYRSAHKEPYRLAIGRPSGERCALLAVPLLDGPRGIRGFDLRCWHASGLRSRRVPVLRIEL